MLVVGLFDEMVDVFIDVYLFLLLVDPNVSLFFYPFFMDLLLYPCSIFFLVDLPGLEEGFFIVD